MWDSILKINYFKKIDKFKLFYLPYFVSINRGINFNLSKIIVILYSIDDLLIKLIIV